MQQDFDNLLIWSEQFNFLPWRQNRSLYGTLVSEIMLQQTTVATVLNKFQIFLNHYPDITTLAKATEEDILVAWKGLGYYRRAKNLLAAARYINAHHHLRGQIPTDYNLLLTIPGIGDYTASAILAIGADQKALAIDTNLERVIARYYGLDVTKGSILKKTILDLFNNEKIFNNNLSFRALNEALMDLGRELCTTTKTQCKLCPLSMGCKSKDNPLIRPVVKKEQKITHELSLLRVLIIENNSLLSYQKTDGEWLAGQWECPTFIVKSSDNIKQYPAFDFPHEHLNSFKTSITKYKISNYILSITYKKFQKTFPWQRNLQALTITNDSNFSTATQKALKKFAADLL